MVFAERLTDFGLIRYLLNDEFVAGVVNAEYAIGLSRIIAKADAMFFGVYLASSILAPGCIRGGRVTVYPPSGLV